MMKPNTYLLGMVFCCLLAGAPRVDAEVLDFRGLKIDVPPGWVSTAAANPRSIEFRQADGKIRITIFIHYHGAVRDPDIKQLARDIAAAESQALAASVMKKKDVFVSHQAATLSQEKGGWQLLSVFGLNDGTELRAVTTFVPGRAIAIGAESKNAGQFELDRAVRLFGGRILIGSATSDK